MRRKRDFQEIGVVLHTFSEKILPTDLIFSFYREVRSKIKLSA